MAVTGEVLVLRALGIGDLLVAVPALRGLRRAFPDDHLVLAAPAGLAELVTLVGAVDELLPTPGLGALHWHRDPPKEAVNLHGSGPESIADLRATTPHRLVTYRHRDVPDVGGPPWPDGGHEVDRWCRLLHAHGIAADPADLALHRPATPSPAPGAVVIHPGAAFPARRWPPERFAEVARRFAADGHHVVVTGSDSERELATHVAIEAGLPPRDVLAGRTGLGELAALVADATLVVCGDTGMGHLATAYGTPSVVLFGPTPPSRWGPPADRRQHRPLWTGQAADPFGTRADPGLLQLSVADVLAAVPAGRVTRPTFSCECFSAANAVRWARRPSP
ncbi:MAG: glycosyltransferase family 9 protein [Actinophytocola sp.]|uniref:glycosyltransferase family 9 protein n=1 Tax=Actinophytocola sp. TaxID=1872138 RepID=UPI0013297809|nr:glycosyltransferase family 9 protein [Actinophytocola sp.]MPZ81888.1 glycosyltransferase family 9 protein [Actinophytocola sp.]